jgi:hypothetical protein
MTEYGLVNEPDENEKVYVVRNPHLLALFGYINDIAPIEDIEEIEIILKIEDE